MVIVKTAELIDSLVEKNICFASYRRAGTKVVSLIQRDPEPTYLQEDDEITEQRGFLVAPFAGSSHCPRLIIRPEIVLAEGADDDDLYHEALQLPAQPRCSADDHCACYQCSREEYYSEIDSIITAINSGKFSKAVLSRVEIIREDISSQLGALFQRMCDAYPLSFVYIFQAAGHIWLGATPETLLSMDQGNLYTVALASTRKNLPENRDVAAWDEKERQEQQYVSDYIASQLEKFSLEQLKRSDVYTGKAGNMLHLCTDFHAAAGAMANKLSPLVNALHPTPAVCGMPKLPARDFLHSLEQHDRQYYAGFLGPVNIDPEVLALYVNLRCMQVHRGYAQVYVGGGITADSQAAAEWAETVLKTKTILSALRS